MTDNWLVRLPSRQKIETSVTWCLSLLHCRVHYRSLHEWPVRKSTDFRMTLAEYAGPYFGGKPDSADGVPGTLRFIENYAVPDSDGASSQ